MKQSETFHSHSLSTLGFCPDDKYVFFNFPCSLKTTFDRDMCTKLKKETV